ncbi:MAG: hypothetical protein IJS82_06125 [Paludibacteraceae bacterium]|nr:hypothetical protein [Paludibacteraceae bacterium]
MNFFDLCAAGARAIGRLCVAFWRLLVHMLRVSYRYWWVVLPVIILGLAAAFYYTRPSNIKHNVNTVVLLNGPSIQQFEQALAPIRSVKTLPQEAAITSLIHNQTATRFETFRVVDCLDDGVADYIDFKHKTVPTDTVNVPMQDRLCLQFRIKTRNLDSVPKVEEALLTYLNGNAAMQKAYEAYYHNLLSETTFNHTQMAKLDSLTSEYYFHNHLGEQPTAGISSGLIWVGDWRVHLFLEDIYDHQKRLQLMDQRLQLATAPVVFENHFAVDAKPLNGRIKFMILFFFLGWIGGCILAELIDQRKALNAWLKA